MKWIEITTQIGCKNMCHYCPQSTLLKQYNDTKRKMTLDDFAKIIENVNNLTTNIHFSGFCEPFLTQDAEKMMILAYEKGFKVLLNTTLEGFNEEKCKILSDNIIFDQVYFHEYEGIGFNKNKFEQLTELFIKNIKSNSYHSSKIENPISRAGNNWNVQRNIGKIRCATNRYYGNVVLPNGDLYLCCNDFGLKHKLGNMYIDHYDSDEIENKRKEIIYLSENYYDSNILCRTCEQYNVYTLGYLK